MFWLGAVSCLTSALLRTKVPESEAWKQIAPHDSRCSSSRVRPMAAIIYLVILMTS